MTASELARFLKVEASRLRLMATKGVRLEVPAARDMLDTLNALDAAVEALKEAKAALEYAETEWDHWGTWPRAEGLIHNALATLRLVVGGKETP